MALWKATPLPNRDDELFSAIITDESGKQLIGQITSFQIAEHIVYLHNALKPDEVSTEQPSTQETQYLCERCGHPESEHPTPGCIAFARLATSEEFNHVTEVRNHLASILERDMTPKMVELLRPYQDYLIRSVMESQERITNVPNKCRCGEWPKESKWIHCPWCGEMLDYGKP